MSNLVEQQRPDPPYEFDIHIVGCAVDDVRDEVMFIHEFLNKFPKMDFTDRVVGLADIIIRHRKNDQLLTILDAAMKNPADPAFVRRLKTCWSLDGEICRSLRAWDETADQAYGAGDYLTLFPILGYESKHAIRADIASGGMRLVLDRLTRAYTEIITTVADQGILNGR